MFGIVLSVDFCCVPIPAGQVSLKRPVSKILILRPGCSEPATGVLNLPVIKRRWPSTPDRVLQTERCHSEFLAAEQDNVNEMLRDIDSQSRLTCAQRALTSRLQFKPGTLQKRV